VQDPKIIRLVFLAQDPDWAKVLPGTLLRILETDPNVTELDNTVSVTAEIVDENKPEGKPEGE
jgi:hypothetical protein